MALRPDRGDAGLRQWWVTIKSRPSSDAVDDSFAPVNGPFTEMATVAARKIELGGDERFRAMQLSAKYDTRWVIRYRPDMDPELIEVAKVRQLVYRSRVYDIVSATMDDRHREIELTTLSKAG